MKYIPDYRQFVNEGVNLKAAHLSSAEYQKAKKLKAFNPADWTWNSKSQLYDKVNESLVTEAKFFRLPNKLNAMWELKNSVDYIVGKHSNGDDYNPAEMKTIEEFIKKIKKSAKAFKDSEEVKGTIYESVVNEKTSFSQMKKDSKTKEYKEVSQAINNAEEVADIWNMLDPKMFKFTESEFEDIFDDWWNNISRYDSVADFSRNAYWEDAHSLYLHLLPYVSESVVTEAIRFNASDYIKAGKLGYNDQFLGKNSLARTLSIDLGLNATDEYVGPWLGFDHVSLYAIGKKGGTILKDALTDKYTYEELKKAAADFMGIKESAVTEAKSEAPDSLLKFMNDEQDEGQDANVHLATFDGSSMEAQSTTKTWDDGVPVTKYFTRGGYKPVSPKGEIWILESERFWYFRYKGVWYAVKIADYGTPPFEY